VFRLLVVAALALVIAPGALAAKPKQIRFAVSLGATITSTWEDQLRTSSDGCQLTAASTGNQRFELRSARPSRITLVARRGHFAKLAGTLSGLVIDASGGESTELTTCGQFTTTECPNGPSSFTGATLKFSRPARGRLQLTDLVAPEFDGWRTCVPRSLVEPAYPLLGRAFGAVTDRALLRRRTVVVTGEREAVTHVSGPDEQGVLRRSFTWAMTFRRLGR
jgi:hypothetical protein